MAVLPIPMEQNCNLELRLSPSISFSNHDSRADESSKTSQQQMTIFYNGKVCVADFTEDEARAIIMLATRQVQRRSANHRPQSSPSASSPSALALSPEKRNGEAGSGSGLSMKRSLQRFLQKRKNRIQSASPYNH